VKEILGDPVWMGSLSSLTSGVMSTIHLEE
jgi:hypothetical protein